MGLSLRGVEHKGWITVKCPKNTLLVSFDEKLLRDGHHEFRIRDGDAIILKREHTLPAKKWSIWSIFWLIRQKKLKSRYGDNTAVKETLILQHDKQRTVLAGIYKVNSGYIMPQGNWLWVLAFLYWMKLVQNQ